MVLYNQGIMKTKFIAFAKEGPEIQIINKNSLKISQGNKNESIHNLDGVEKIQKNISNAFTTHIKPIIQNKKISSKNCFISFSSENESFLTGYEGAKGVIDFSAEEFFKQDGKNHQLVSISMIAIGSDGSLYDLINPSKQVMNLKHHSKLGLLIEDVTELVVQNEVDLIQLFKESLQVMASMQLKCPSCLFTVNNKLVPKGGKASNAVDIRTQFLFSTLNVKDAHLIKGTVGNIKQNAKEQSVMYDLLKDCFEHNNVCVIAEINNKDKSIDSLILEICESARSIKSKPSKLTSFEDSVDKLRTEIDVLRERIFDQNVPNIKDVELMENMTSELRILKRRSWDEIVQNSVCKYQERSINLQNRGLAWIISSSQKPMSEKVLKLQQQLKELQLQFKQQCQNVEQINTQLKNKTENYSAYLATGKDASSKMTSEIKELKEKSKVEVNKLNSLREKLQTCRTNYRSQSEQGKNGMSNNFDVAISSLINDRDKFREENKIMVDEELKRCKLIVNHESEVLKSKDDELKSEKLELIKLRAEKKVLSTQLDILRKEKDKSDEDLKKVVQMHKKQIDMHKSHSLQTFRAYKLVCDEYKDELETRWKSLLDEAIKDAVFIKSRNQELNQSNKKLSRENAALRDQVASKTL